MKSNTKGVSPLIGTLMLIVIVLVLSLFIAKFAFNVTSKLNSPPIVHFYLFDHKNKVSYSTDKLFVIQHTCGESIKANKIEIVVFTSNYNDILKYNTNDQKWHGDKLAAEITVDTGRKNVIEAGDEIIVYEKTNLISKPEEIEVKIIYDHYAVLYDAKLTLY